MHLYSKENFHWLIISAFSICSNTICKDLVNDILATYCNAFLQQNNSHCIYRNDFGISTLTTYNITTEINRKHSLHKFSFICLVFIKILKVVFIVVRAYNNSGVKGNNVLLTKRLFERLFFVGMNVNLCWQF